MPYALRMSATDARTLFMRIAAAPDDAISLDEAALLIAQEEYPDLDRARYLRRLDELAVAARSRVECETSPYGVANALSDYLFEDQKFRGNAEDYYSPRNSFLNDVLDRGFGIPITLSVLYMEVARRLDLTVHGIGLPGHFIVRFDAPDEQILIDPFHRGTILAQDDCRALMSQAGAYSRALEPSLLAPVSKREILYRMLNNLKTVYLSDHDYRRALIAVERLVLLRPDDAHETRLRDRLRDVVS